MKISREQEVEYRSVIASARDEMVGIALRALASNALERVKERAITPGEQGIETLRGEAAAWKEVLKFLTVQPASTKQV